MNLKEWCETNNRNLIKEWCDSKNKFSMDKYSKSSKEKVWWSCMTCNSIWQAQIRKRTIDKTGCPFCSKIKCAELIKQQKKKNKYTNNQIKVLREAYPINDWETIFKYFPNSNKTAIKGYANKHNIYKNKKNLLSNEDITNRKFNLLTAICVDKKIKNIVYWKCKCDCGNFVSVPIYSLIQGTTKSCGCLRHNVASNSKDFTGMRFGMLTAVERLPRYKGNDTYYKCKCTCGNYKIVRSGNLRSGHTVSCGTHNHKKIEYWGINHNNEEDRRTYYVYRHVSPNGKSYIGITKQDPDKRFQNGNGYSSQIAFWRAINKYGWGNFKHEIIEDNLTEKEACEREVYYINEVYKSLAPHGYNTQKGGTTGLTLTTPIIQYYKGVPVNFFESVTEASKKLNIARSTINSHIGKENKVDEYFFERLPKIHIYDIEQKYWNIKDESHYDISKIVAEELRKTTITRNLKCSKPINKYSLDGKFICTYKSIAEAKRATGRKKAEAICAAVNPNRKGNTAYGFVYRYDNGNHEDIAPVKCSSNKY